VVNELAKGEVAFADLPALGPESHTEVIVDLGDRARLRLREEDGRESYMTTNHIKVTSCMMTMRKANRYRG